MNLKGSVCQFFGEGLDHVDVAEEENRLGRACASTSLDADDEILLARVWSKQAHFAR